MIIHTEPVPEKPRAGGAAEKVKAVAAAVTDRRRPSGRAGPRVAGGEAPRGGRPADAAVAEVDRGARRAVGRGRRRGRRPAYDDAMGYDLSPVRGRHARHDPAVADGPDGASRRRLAGADDPDALGDGEADERRPRRGTRPAAFPPRRRPPAYPAVSRLTRARRRDRAAFTGAASGDEPGPAVRRPAAGVGALRRPGGRPMRRLLARHRAWPPSCSPAPAARPTRARHAPTAAAGAAAGRRRRPRAAEPAAAGAPTPATPTRPATAGGRLRRWPRSAAGDAAVQTLRRRTLSRDRRGSRRSDAGGGRRGRGADAEAALTTGGTRLRQQSGAGRPTPQLEDRCWPTWPPRSAALGADVETRSTSRARPAAAAPRPALRDADRPGPVWVPGAPMAYACLRRTFVRRVPACPRRRCHC